MTACSKCGTEIEMSFCPKCGQEYRKEPLTLFMVIKDYFNSFFSLDGSLVVDIKEVFIRPKRYISNYWNGFRRGQSSPNRILVLSTLFVGLALLLSDKSEFLGLQMQIENFSAPLLLLFLVLPALTLSTYLAYFGYKKTLAEHLVLNCYVLGIWMIVLSPISVAVDLLEWPWMNVVFRGLFMAAPFVWVARVFHQKWWKTGLMLLLHLGMCSLFIFGIAYLLATNSSS